jgi:hypothetical protein
VAAIEPEGNGKAKAAKTQVAPIRTLFHPPGQRGQDNKRSIFEAFISSDHNNPTKSRIPNPAGMAVYQLLGVWGSTKNQFKYRVQGKEKVFPKSIEGMHELFKGLYDEDAISFDGKSREEAETAAIGYYLQDVEDIQAVRRNRVGEGGGTSKK